MSNVGITINILRFLGVVAMLEPSSAPTTWELKVAIKGKSNRETHLVDGGRHRT